MFLWNLGSFRPLFLQISFFSPMCVYSPSRTPIEYVDTFDVAQAFKATFILFPFFILFLCSSDKIISVDLSSILFFLVPNQIYCWFLMVNFSCQLLYFSNPKFLFASFKNNLFLLTLCILWDLILIDSVIM